MLAIYDAVGIATSHLKLLIPDAENVLLEEVELSEDDQFWLITLGFTHPGLESSGPLAAVIGMPRQPRKYKVFRINRSTGEVRSMKIRRRPPMFESEIVALLNKHRSRGILVDANLLLLLLVGLCDPNLIERFKRTQTFTKKDFELLALFLGRFRQILTTPGILAEVNSLSNQLQERIKPTFFAVFKDQIAALDERYRPSLAVCQHVYFAKCGLTDSAIMTVAEDGLLVLTDDFRLAGILDHLGIDVVNFNHVRFLLAGV